jgi:small subunit ribosomal protein S16
MAVKIRMKRMGRSHLNFFRVNAVDSRFPRDGRVIEELGHYNPQSKDDTKKFVVDLDRCKYWLDKGAIPSETVSSMLKKAGVEHKGLVLPRPGKPKPKVEEKKAATA